MRALAAVPGHAGPTCIADVADPLLVSGTVLARTSHAGGHRMSIDIGQVSRAMVRSNDVLFGSANATRRHGEAAAALTRAERGWHERLVTRRTSPGRGTGAAVRWRQRRHRLYVLGRIPPGWRRAHFLVAPEPSPRSYGLSIAESLRSKPGRR